ncbi:ABC transporter substrate-binding protein [Vibrio sp. Isolate25]|uniref:ABC transporter substrate-binding protein n=1 Tax=Vibrio sp. Isolate25 TaxID=2908535 RepID=UPI001EFE73F8|nr:ABC transporter substrate-binding protein [Vibrio sp. Isolate25]MCG9596070.1 ABC transporter substrate-binding protein [Vibrio sp. Isolate25]
MNDASLRRLQQLLIKYESGKTYHLSIDELEIALSTSRRNTSNILRSLSDIGWISWLPSKGRGKLSQFKIMHNLQGALEHIFSKELEQGRFSNISRLMDLYGHLAVKALAEATVTQASVNERCDSLLITEYPWVDTLEPAKTYRIAEMQVIRSVYSTLLTQDESGRIQAGLAHSWKVEGRFIHLWLRQDIICHDGEVLEATDVSECLHRLKVTDGPVKYLFEQVIGIRVLVAGQVTIELQQPNPLFLHVLCVVHASIYRLKSTYFSSGLSTYIGSGPFYLKDWDRERLVLKRHRNYYAQSALLDKITLSSSSELSDFSLSFNKDGDCEESTINALSYLAIHLRPDAEVSRNNLHRLVEYLRRCRANLDSETVVNDVSFTPCLERISDDAPPRLNGHLVLTMPRLTIPYLKKIAKWLKSTILETGLTLEILELEDISNPSSVSDYADILFIEEVIEQPEEFGLYDWLLACSGLKFIYDQTEMNTHYEQVKHAMSDILYAYSLRKIEQGLYDKNLLLPLFHGKEKITRSLEVHGVETSKSGLSEFYKLWIDKEKQ